MSLPTFVPPLHRYEVIRRTAKIRVSDAVVNNNRLFTKGEGHTKNKLFSVFLSLFSLYFYVLYIMYLLSFSLLLLGQKVAFSSVPACRVSLTKLRSG